MRSYQVKLEAFLYDWAFIYVHNFDWDGDDLYKLMLTGFVISLYYCCILENE